MGDGGVEIQKGQENRKGSSPGGIGGGAQGHGGRGSLSPDPGDTHRRASSGLGLCGRPRSTLPRPPRMSGPATRQPVLTGRGADQQDGPRQPGQQPGRRPGPRRRGSHPGAAGQQGAERRNRGVSGRGPSGRQARVPAGPAHRAAAGKDTRQSRGPRRRRALIPLQEFPFFFFFFNSSPSRRGAFLRLRTGCLSPPRRKACR